MSIAGVRSSRGDVYQTHIALGWAIQVLSSPDYEWIEVDSLRFQVDDVVIGRTDGTVICCQCKKNQPDFTNWSPTELEGDLTKAGHLLLMKPEVSIQFYSRSPFGGMAKLREHAVLQPDQTTYDKSLTDELKTIDEALKSSLGIGIGTQRALCRTTFEVTPEFEKLRARNMDHLRQLLTNSENGYVHLWTALDELGGRVLVESDSVAGRHRLTKQDIQSILRQAGCIVSPPYNVRDSHRALSGISIVGRNWRRDIGGAKFAHPATSSVSAAIDAGARSILLIGQPGSGKTCALLDLLEAIEKRWHTVGDVFPVFVQTREFADLASAADREALGLMSNWIEVVARMAESTRVAVLFDSLDVLSIARERKALDYFLTCLERLAAIPGVATVTACRAFDRRHDHRIARQSWAVEVQCTDLPWLETVAPFLLEKGINPESLNQDTRRLLQNPRHLSLFVDLSKNGSTVGNVTEQSLAQRYLDEVVVADPSLGQVAIQHIESMAVDMLTRRSLTVPEARFQGSEVILRNLRSNGIMAKTEGGGLTFGHQTLVDVLAVRGAMRRGLTLNQFIQELRPVPFVRPTIRAYIAALATSDRTVWRREMRAVLTGEHPFHIRRLVAESMALDMPTDADWALVRDLFYGHKDVFQVFFQMGISVTWFLFWQKHLAPKLVRDHDTENYSIYLSRVSLWKKDAPEKVAALWTEALELDWIDRDRLIQQLGFSMMDMDDQSLPAYADLIAFLARSAKGEHSFLGATLAKALRSGVVDDVTLWNYVAGEVTSEDAIAFHLNGKLRCAPHDFGTGGESFLAQRMSESEKILELAVSSVEQWSQAWATKLGLRKDSTADCFLMHTGFRKLHEHHDFGGVDAINVLMDSIEAGILANTRSGSVWWESNKLRLVNSLELALRYFAVLALQATADANHELVFRVLGDRSFLLSRLDFEIGELMNESVPLLDSTQVRKVEEVILQLGDGRTEEDDKAWIDNKIASYVRSMPRPFRSEIAQKVLDDYESEHGLLRRSPRVFSSGGTVSSPVGYSTFGSLNEDNIVLLLKFYEGVGRWHDFDEPLIGGEQEVGHQLQEASKRSPSRFLRLLVARWNEIGTDFRSQILEGLAMHLRFRGGSLESSAPWVADEEPGMPWLAEQILLELERHLDCWQDKMAGATALRACVEILGTEWATRLVLLALRMFVGTEDDTATHQDPASAGLNSRQGRVAESAMILANNLIEAGGTWPELLAPALRRFARVPDSGARAMIISRLAFLQHHVKDLGQELFGLAMSDPTGLWSLAERCLYFNYHRRWEWVCSQLLLLKGTAHKEGGETWGRISALAVLAGKLDLADLLLDLCTLASEGCWLGAAQVWSEPRNLHLHRAVCLRGLESGLSTAQPFAGVVARQLSHLFGKGGTEAELPKGLIERFFQLAQEEKQPNQLHLFGIVGWLNSYVSTAPTEGLAAAECYLEFARNTNSNIYNHENELTQMMTRLFEVAEELEESDSGEMLRRTVVLQDALLSRQVNGIDDWLREAERP